MLTETQMQTLAAGLRAETDAEVVDAMVPSRRNDVFLAEWCNANGTQDAWNPAMTARLLFEATAVAKFDNLTAGKRDAWRMIMDYAPQDMARNKVRSAVVDIWGATDSVAVLQSCTRKATHGEQYIGGTSATENTITALKLNFSGMISVAEVGAALNRY